MKTIEYDTKKVLNYIFLVIVPRLEIASNVLQGMSLVSSYFSTGHVTLPFRTLHYCTGLYRAGPYQTMPDIE